MKMCYVKLECASGIEKAPIHTLILLNHTVFCASICTKSNYLQLMDGALIFLNIIEHLFFVIFHKSQQLQI